MTTASPFIVRLHTSNMPTDLYQVLGPMTEDEFLEELQDVDWTAEFQQEAEEFNPITMEVRDSRTGYYLGISIIPNEGGEFQFFVAFGTHVEEDGEVERMVKMYGTGSEEAEVPLQLAKDLYARNFRAIQAKLGELDFFDEIEDMYLNLDD